MKYKIPKGHSVVTINLFGKDIRLAAIPDDTLKTITKVLSFVQNPRVIQLKLSSGSIVKGIVKKALPEGLVVHVNGKDVIVRRPDASKRILGRVDKGTTGRRHSSSVHKREELGPGGVPIKRARVVVERPSSS